MDSIVPRRSPAGEERLRARVANRPSATSGVRLDGSMCAAECKAAVVDAVALGRFARRTVSRSHCTVVGMFPSSKMRATFPVESSVEADVLVLADVLESVRLFLPQALRVVFPFQGRLRIAYPDIAIIRDDGEPEFWECKPDGVLGDERFARLLALRGALHAVGIPYRVRQPGWCRREPLASNAAMIRRHAEHDVPHRMVGLASRAGGSGPTTLGALGRKLKATMPVLLTLAAGGIIAVDIGDAPLGEDTLVRQPSPGATSGAFDGSASAGDR